MKDNGQGPRPEFLHEDSRRFGDVLNKGDQLLFAIDDHRDGIPGISPFDVKDLFHRRFLARIDTEAVEGFRRERHNATLADDSYGLRESLFIGFPGIDFQMDGHFRFSCFRSTSLAILRI